ncbi:MAG: hypothetical protein K2R98_09670 [Gemmataceae bacterium]|nr:hypothetical protein [Gemmataceae bacterium]
MSRVWALGLVVVVTALTAVPAQAGGCCWRTCCTPCVTYTVTWVDKVVTCYQPQWQERDVTCTVMRCVPREVVEQRTVFVSVPEWKEEKRVITVCRSVPREVVREVTCCRMVPVTCTDPCTGCCYTSCKPELYTVQVKSIVCDQVPEQREIVCRVCSYRAEERVIQCRRCVMEYKPETVVRKERFCVMVPVQTTVKVPVCTAVPCCQ